MLASERSKQLGVFHAVRTRDAVAQTRDGWPFFVLNRRGRNSHGEKIYEIRFGDGEWMLAAEEDLSRTL